MRSNKRKRVLLAPWYYDRAHHMGIARYAGEAGWILQDTRAQVRSFDPDFIGDGIISFHGGDEPFIKFLKAQTVPVVDMGEYAHLSDFPRVRTAAVEIGRMAAEYFANRGFKNVGFIAGSAQQRRLDAMQQTSASLGLNFTVLTTAQLRAKGHQLPRPLGLLAATDGVAVHAMVICEEIGLLVPEQIAIMGVDNDECRCLPAPVTLTSIDPNLQRMGYEAAALLDRLMDGQPPPAEPIDIPPQGIVERESTNILATDDLEVASALRFIFQNFAEPITVADVGAQAGVGLRSLQARFSTALNRNILDVINRRRVEEAQRLLLEGQLKLHGVAKASGFGDSVRLIRAFRRYTGTTPRGFVRSHHE